MSRSTLFVFALLLATSAVAVPVDVSKLPPASKTPADFTRDIEPLLKARCTGCHGRAQQLSGLQLDSKEAALRGGYSGPVIVPGKSAESRLIHLVAGADEKVVMPPAGKRLTPQEVGVLRAWIDAGAPWSEAVVSKSGTPAKKIDERTQHWSFRPVQRLSPPRVTTESWARNPIDRFILARLEREGISPSPEASKTTLLRRVSLDLTGLPPTPGETAAFLTDNRPDAYERVVDRLLNSPHYGEKWARQWLDLARYADSDGYEKDNERPHAWRYRHWVINALNADMPFDEFTIQQLAGDLLPDSSTEQKVATGFHRNTLTNREGGINIEQFRNEQVVDRVATTGTVWLGLTVGCAQCHDHKYDPIKQRDFYSLFAFFNNTLEEDIDAPLAGEMGPYLKGLTDYRNHRAELLAKYRVPELQPAWEERMRQAAANPGKWTDWDHAYDAFQKYLDNADKILHTPVEKRTVKQTDAIADHFVINYHRVITKELNKELNFPELRKKLQELRASFPALSEAQTMAQDTVLHRNTNIHIRGDYRNKGVEVQPDVPGFLPPLSAGKEPPSRLTLARWIVSPGNPLTARVAVNRMWQEFFGRGLVRTSDDFGRQGEPPTHPELLDWLASSFMDGHWRVKQMHRLIVTSATYRQSSDIRKELETRDPSNTLLAKQSRLRLPAELIRDNALAASELLQTDVGGRSVRPYQPPGVSELAYGSGVKWKNGTGQDRYRRGLYIHFQRTVPYPQLINFDSPDTTVTACRRERSNTPLQALNLLNDPVFVEAAQALAARILRETPGQPLPQRLQTMFQACLTRRPSPAEQDGLAAYYNTQSQIFEKDPASAKQLFPLRAAHLFKDGDRLMDCRGQRRSEPG